MFLMQGVLRLLLMIGGDQRKLKEAYIFKCEIDVKGVERSKIYICIGFTFPSGLSIE